MASSERHYHRRQSYPPTNPMSTPHSAQNAPFGEDHRQLPDASTSGAADTGCTHIRAALGDPSTAAPLKTKYKAVVAWHARKTQDAISTPPAKRRRVCPLWCYCIVKVNPFFDRLLLRHAILAVGHCRARSHASRARLRDAGQGNI